MRDDLRTVLHDVGAILAAVGVLTLSAVAVGALFGEWWAALVMAGTAGLFAAIGQALRVTCADAEEPRLKHAMLTAATSWLLIAVLSMPPFVLVEGLPLVEAFFEGMSGWTATGLTMIPDIESSTHVIQYWRSFSEWVGGVGIIVLTLIVLVRPGTASFALYRSETRQERLRPSVVGTVRTIWKIYLLYTALSILLVFALLPEGTPERAWHALNLAMTGIATGGFSITNTSIAAYDSVRLEMGLTVIMILGAIPFVAHYDLLRGRVERFLEDLQTAGLLGIILAVGALVTLTHPGLAELPFVGLREGFFQTISAATTTGFQTVDLAAWSDTGKLLLIATMVVGGAAGSTVGGVKIVRALLLAKAVHWKIKEIYLPRGAYMQHRFAGRVLDRQEVEESISDTALIAFLWLVFLFLGLVALSWLVPARPLVDVAFDVASAQSGVGLSTGVTSVGMPDLGKLTLAMNMWVGRLEIIPVLMIVQALLGTSPYDRFVRGG